MLALALAFWFGWSEWARHMEAENRPPVLRAIDILRRQVEEAPTDVELRMQLAQAYTIAGADREAAEQYEYVLSIDAHHVPAVMGLGRISSRHKDWKASEGYWRRSLELLSADGGMAAGGQREMAAFHLGTAQLAQRKCSDAVASFKQAQRLSPAAPDTHYQLAIAYRGLGDDVQYRDSLERALESDPMMPEANYDYAFILLKDGDRAGAAEHLRRSADHRPDPGTVEQALKRLGPAAERIRVARELADTDPTRALEEARIAVAIEPDEFDAQVLLGELYQRRGEATRAEKAYRAALALDPGNARVRAAIRSLEDGVAAKSAE